MTNLNQSAQAILGQISASQILMAGATQAASSGDILNPGVMQTAAISDTMQNNYNNAIQAVIDANYYGAHELFMDCLLYTSDAADDIL
jgi:hypothetical protein